MPLASAPNRPRMSLQGDNPCVIRGHDTRWLNCTCDSGAMVLDVVTFGKVKVSGCTIRALTGDTIGGTSIPQVTAVLRRRYGVNLEERIGSNAATPEYIAKMLRNGRPMMAQGNTSALLNHGEHISTRTPINHCVEYNEGTGWHRNRRGFWVPTKVLAYDPAADKRYYWVDRGPSWWTWDECLDFLGALRPWGDRDPRKLGRGRGYVAVAPPARVRFRYGGVKTNPFPDRVRVLVPKGMRAPVRYRPDRINVNDIVDRLPRGALFVAYQRALGVRPKGAVSRWWYGDETGHEWIHEESLTNKGGAH